MRHGRLRRVLVEEGTAQGQMMFWDATHERWVPAETSELFWDDTAKILKPVALTVAGCTVLGLDSAVFQPTADSATFFQILDADGGTPVFNVDTTNERIGIGTASPVRKIHLYEANDHASMWIQTGNAGKAAEVLLEQPDNMWSFGVTSDGDFKVRDNTGAANVFRILKGAPAFSFAIIASGYIGFGGETDPETLIEMTSIAPYLTLHNSTHEDTDGGRESRLNFKGEQSGGEETTLARIEISHDGAADDQKGKIVISTNDGSDADTPTEALTIDSARNIKASGNTISDSSGNLTSANGANFGPAGVTSITVLNGIVTAIS